jgi:geranylgeranyl diphosphate synthase, type I
VLSAADSHLPAVEALMRQLCAGEAPELLGRIATEHLDTGGKRLRARLALAAVEALGGRAPDAVACELLHNATLIHDDIEDGDRARRGQPTAWARHGVAQAINAGDLLFLLPFAAAERVAAGSEARLRLCGALAKRGAAVIRGQAAEMALTAARRADRAAYFAAITGKTSGLFELPVEGAAILTGVPEARVVPAFSQLGVLFQLQDDVLDLFGDKGRSEVGADLREGKVSALVVAHLELHPEDGAWLVELLGRPRDQTSDAEVERAIERFRAGGALRLACRWIEERAADLRALPTPVGGLLAELVDLVLAPVAGVLAAARA